jgi:hypothetical protein
MEEEFENNDSLINNFQEELKNSKDDFKQEETILDEEIFQYTPNLKEIAKKDFSRYINKQLTPNKNKNDLVNNLNFKYTNDYNMNLDISGISLLKELEEQWNNIEKQKNISINNKNNKNDESTYSNSKSNTIFDKFKYITEMVEIKKNKFISSREKAKKERNDDKEIENYFLNKLKEMDKYKIIDEELKKNIEIRQEQKNNEDNYYNQQENENNINNNINDNENIEIRTPALEDLVYETPARVNNYINEYDNDNEDNVNIDNMNTRKEKNMMSGKLFNKMKNLYKEINGENNEENMEQNNSNESGVFGINNFNIKTDKNEENIILKNIRNNNNIIINENNGNINDANKSISLNFNFINKNKNFVQKYEQNKFIKYNDIIRYTNDKNNINLIAPKENLNIFKDKNRMTLSGLQENFDEILKNVKSNHNTNNISLFNNNQIKDEDYEDKEEFDKYFQDLSNEAKSNIRKNKNISEPYSKNKILKKIEENSFILNEYISGNSQNKNIFKQRMKDLNNNFNNIRDNDINNKSFQTKQFSRYNLFPNNII